VNRNELRERLDQTVRKALTDARYDSSQGLGVRRLMEHHVEQLTPQIVAALLSTPDSPPREVREPDAAHVDRLAAWLRDRDYEKGAYAGYRKGSWSMMSDSAKAPYKDEAFALLTAFPFASPPDREAVGGDLLERVAQITAHRPITNEEHDGTVGLLAGYCVVCRTPWPCEYAGRPLAGERSEGEREALDDAIASLSSIREKAGGFLWKSRHTEPGHICDYRSGLQSVRDVAKRALQRLGEARAEFATPRPHRGRRAGRDGAAVLV
jgi:hypothetical protein